MYFGGSACTRTIVSCSRKVNFHERKNSVGTLARRASSLRLYSLHSRVSPECGVEISDSCVLIRGCESSQQPQARLGHAIFGSSWGSLPKISPVRSFSQSSSAERV